MKKIITFFIFVMVFSLSSMHGVYIPYGNQANPMKYVGSIKHCKVSMRNIWGRSKCASEENPRQFIKYVPEKTREIRELEERRDAGTYFWDKWNSGSICILGVGIALGGIDEELAIGALIIGEALMTPCLLYREKLRRESIEKEISCILVPQLTQRKKLNRNIREINCILEAHGFDDEMSEKVTLLHRDLTSLDDFDATHDDEKFAELNKKIATIRALKN